MQTATKQALSPRLNRILELVRPGRGLIDVGTDHGYLPIQLIKNGYHGTLIASDLREGPLAAARENAQQAGIQEQISFLLCDGLDACPPEAVDTIVIAGMGGDTICGILDRAEWCMSASYRLILQPMSKPEVLRYWLCSNGFRIEQEALAAEGETIYQIFSAVFQDQNEPLTDAELFIGKHGLADKALYLSLAEQQLHRIDRRILGLEKGTDARKKQCLPWLKSLSAELKTIRGASHDHGSPDL